jgi:hypothetical protein
MMRYVLLSLLALFLIYEKSSRSEEVAGSKNFHLSGGMSKQMYLLMRKSGVGGENLKKFVQLEDRFLQIERNSVCSGIPNYVEGAVISNLIKEMFPQYNFAYHTTHLKQIGEPLKNVNSRIKC